MTLRGYNEPAAFGAGVADATEPSDLPTPFHMVIATYGIARAYEQQEDPTMAAQYFAVFNQELDNLRARYEDTPSPQPIIVGSRRASRWLSQTIFPGRYRYSWE